MDISKKKITYKNFFITLLLITCFSLQACSSLLIIGTAAFISTIWNDPRTFGTQLDDKLIQIHVQYVIEKKNNIQKFSRIKSTVYRGNVLLTGQTPSNTLIKKFTETAMTVEGTKNIYNAIRKNSPIPLPSILADTWISTQIYLNFFIQKNIYFSNIKVTTENKEVFLLGKVTHSEGKWAEKIAKNTSGVRQVFSYFSYI